MRKKGFVFFASIIVLVLSGCKEEQGSKENIHIESTKPNFQLTKVVPHDPEAFTQGLIYHDEQLIEGTGQKGTSWISTLNPQSLEYDKRVVVPPTYFGEGITILNNKIYQLTYKSRVGFIYNLETFEKIGEFKYDARIKEGWGLTHNGIDLIMSDGTNKLYFLDSTSLEVKNTLSVKSRIALKSNLNELEYIKGYIYANIWKSNEIVKIDPKTGDIVASYDLSSLHAQAKSANPKIDVLNGIAYDEQRDELIVTGKYWSNYYYISLK